MTFTITVRSKKFLCLENLLAIEDTYRILRKCSLDYHEPLKKVLSQTWIPVSSHLLLHFACLQIFKAHSKLITWKILFWCIFIYFMIILLNIFVRIMGSYWSVIQKLHCVNAQLCLLEFPKFWKFCLISNGTWGLLDLNPMSQKIQ